MPADELVGFVGDRGQADSHGLFLRAVYVRDNLAVDISGNRSRLPCQKFDLQIRKRLDCLRRVNVPLSCGSSDELAFEERTAGLLIITDDEADADRRRQWPEGFPVSCEMQVVTATQTDDFIDPDRLLEPLRGDFQRTA